MCVLLDLVHNGVGYKYSKTSGLFYLSSFLLFTLYFVQLSEPGVTGLLVTGFGVLTLCSSYLFYMFSFRFKW